MRKVMVLLVGLTLFLALLTSCAEETSNESSLPTESPEDQKATEEEYAWTAKYNQYVEYSNWAGSTLIKNTMHDYVDKFGSEEEFIKPSFERDAVLTILDEYNYNIVARTTESAENGMSLGEIDTAALQSIQETLVFMALWDEIADYYKNEGFLQDDYGKAQQYHEALFYSYYNMAESFDVFSEHFTEMTIESELKEVDALKESGLFTLAAAYSLIMDSKSILRLFPVDEYWSDEFFAVSPEIYEKSFDQYVASLATLETYLNDEEGAAEEGLSTGQIAQIRAIFDVAGEMSMPYLEDIGKILHAGSLDADVHDPNLRNNTAYNPVDNLSGLLNSIVSYYNLAIS